MLSLGGLLLTSSCYGQKNSESLKILNIRYEVVSEIPKDDLISDFSDYYQPNGANYIIFFNKKNYAFSILDFSDMTLKEICRTKENPAIKNWFYDDTKKEIYIFDDENIEKYNSSGKLISKSPIPQLKNGVFEITNNLFKPVIHNENLYFYLYPKVSGNFRNPDFYSKPIEGCIKSNKTKSVIINQQYPQNYHQYFYGYMYAPQRIEISDDQHGFFFTYNDSIFIYDLETAEKSSHYLGSKREKIFQYLDFKEIPNLNETVFEELMYSNPFYNNGGYAFFSKLYFRKLCFPNNDSLNSNQNIVPHLNENKKEKTCRKFDERYTLILYDSNYMYIGESDLMKNIGYIADSKIGLLSFVGNDENIVVRKIIWKE